MPVGSSGRHASCAGLGSNALPPGGVFETVTSRSGVRTKSISW